MRRKIWKIRASQNGESILGSLFAARGLADDEQIKKFLDPVYQDHFDPFLMKDMDLAAARIESALDHNEKITVYADYDADAVTAAAVLMRFFQHINFKNVDYYIPDRFSEGYGMNPEAMKILKERGTNLIITVDCGINAFESIEAANELGIDVIITDHHQLTGGGIPAARAVVNPHRPDDSYPFKDLTGVGVAFKLVQALSSVIASGTPRGNPNEIASESTPRNDIKQWEKWLLDLVAVGTVADCQSLLGENRIFVKWGMYVIQKSRWIGLRKLLKLANIAGTEIDSYKIGFIIAPRINAAGRMEHADGALQLLLTDNETEAEALAQKLEDLNHMRQQQTERILSEAREQMILLGDQKILVAAGEGWHKGIVGLVAGKLTEEFYRPVLVMDKTGQEATGSARSVGNFNIIEAIGQSREILVKYGGHPQAAGFTLRSENIEIFRKNLLEYAETSLTEEDLSQVLHYDALVALRQINGEFIEFVSRFEPTGQGNPRPRFRIDGLNIKKISAIGKDGSHLRLFVEQEGTALGCIAFKQGFWANKLKERESVDVICEPQFNEWNGEKKIQLKIIDLNHHE